MDYLPPQTPYLHQSTPPAFYATHVVSDTYTKQQAFFASLFTTNPHPKEERSLEHIAVDNPREMKTAPRKDELWRKLQGQMPRVPKTLGRNYSKKR